jgi:dihydroorotase
MRLIIKSVKIVWEDSLFHNQTLDILVEDGIIESIGPQISREGAEIWDEKGSCLSPGFFDLDANFGEPGFENREDIESGSKAALMGGFTGLALMPNTYPPFHSRTEIEYVLNKSENLPIDLYPIGCISKNREGKEMAELYDMFQTGALAFSDGDRPLQNSGLLLRALQYTQAFGARIFSYPEENSLVGGAKVNESLESLRLGMKGIPSLSEELMIQRDLMIAQYAQSPIHFLAISTKGAVELIRQARSKGQKVTCSVPAYQLVLNDSKLRGFDTNYKVRPPLRGDEDIEALIEGLIDGTIGSITSRHTPQEMESKAVEFEMALDGMASLEISFSLAIKALRNRLDLNQIIVRLSQGPRSILGIDQPELKIGHSANFCWFHPEKIWVPAKGNLAGKSFNSPFLGEKLEGKVLGILNKNKSIQF